MMCFFCFYQSLKKQDSQVGYLKQNLIKFFCLENKARDSLQVNREKVGKSHTVQEDGTLLKEPFKNMEQLFSGRKFNRKLSFAPISLTRVSCRRSNSCYQYIQSFCDGGNHLKTLNSSWEQEEIQNEFIFTLMEATSVLFSSKFAELITSLSKWQQNDHWS